MILIAVLASLALVTALGTAWIERAYPPRGRFVDVKGVRLHVVDMVPPGAPADALPVVLVHGASANLESLRKPVADMLVQNRRVILIDRPGHGWSTRENLRDSTPAVQARMIDEALGKMNIPRAILVAHSWAGGLGAALALAHPARLAGLVLISPATHSWTTGIAWYHHVGTTPLVGQLFARTVQLPIGALMLKPGARHVFAPQVMPDDYARSSALALVLRPAEFIANAWDMETLKDALAAQSPRYGEITTPTIIITGDTDDTVSPDIHSRPLSRAIKGAELIVLPGVGHLPHEARPDIIVDAVDRLARHAASRGAQER